MTRGIVFKILQPDGNLQIVNLSSKPNRPKKHHQPAFAPSEASQKITNGSQRKTRAAVARNGTKATFYCEICRLLKLKLKKFTRRDTMLRHIQEQHNINTVQKPAPGRQSNNEPSKPLILQGRYVGRPFKQARTGKPGRPRKNPPGVLLLTGKQLKKLENVN